MGRRIVVIFVLGLLLAGCSTAGPFVSNISSDGKGGLNIEKQKVQYNGFLGVVGTTETTESNIQLYQSTSK